MSSAKQREQRHLAPMLLYMCSHTTIFFFWQVRIEEQRELTKRALQQARQMAADARFATMCACACVCVRACVRVRVTCVCL